MERMTVRGDPYNLEVKVTSPLATGSLKESVFVLGLRVKVSFPDVPGHRRPEGARRGSRNGAGVHCGNLPVCLCFS